jgi:hypothetical protein
MIMPSDPDYKATKPIKQGRSKPPEPFRALVAAVSKAFGMAVLNAIYEMEPAWKRPRLTIVLDRERDAKTFFKSPSWDPEAQARVRALFAKVQGWRLFGRRYETDNLFVVFNSFERVARIDAVNQVTKKELEDWKTRLGDPDLWLIQTMFAGVTIFYHTDAQAKAARDTGKLEAFAADFAKVVRPHDEFGYIADAPANTYIDSKENFDTNHQSNWYHYYK